MAPTILVVDDAVENILILSEGLSADFEIRFATSGPEALKILGEGGPIDLLLLDVMMPGMSGLDVLRELRRTRSASELPIIMISARDDSQDIVSALELGANDYVTKPIDLTVLKARIRVQMRVRVPSSQPPVWESSTMLGKPSAKDRGPDLTGKVFAEKYRLEDQIGSGGCGKVYRSTHLYLKQEVALKVLHAKLSTAPEHLARFQREGVAASRLRHPNAVSVLDFGVTADGTAYLVMELLQGTSLRSAMKHGPMPFGRCCEILEPVCDVLGEAHRIGFLHRDLKPDNIFLHHQDGEEVVKVVDFGTAKILAGDETITQEGMIIGTPLYMAPERLDGTQYDEASDIYSLGVTAYEMLAGAPPFELDRGNLQEVICQILGQKPRPLMEAAPDTPAHLAEVVMATIQEDPTRRPPVEEMGRVFTDVAKG